MVISLQKKSDIAIFVKYIENPKLFCYVEAYWNSHYAEWWIKGKPKKEIGLEMPDNVREWAEVGRVRLVGCNLTRQEEILSCHGGVRKVMIDFLHRARAKDIVYTRWFSELTGIPSTECDDILKEIDFWKNIGDDVNI